MLIRDRAELDPIFPPRQARGVRVLLVDWDVASAHRRAQELERRGLTVVVETTDGGRAYRRARGEAFDAVVIELSRRPSHGVELARSLREAKATRGLPVLLVDVADERAEAVSRKVPGARLVAGVDVADAVAALSAAGG